MRIAIITYHYGYNEGTLLQAYATQMLLEEAFPDATVEVIDWRCAAKEVVAFAQPKNGRERRLRAFFEESLHLSDRTFRMHPPTDAFDYIRKRCDLVVVGSDELWRLDYTTEGSWPFRSRVQRNPWAPPFPNVYWPDAAELRVPCVSLASSISENDLVASIPSRHRRKMASVLRNLSLLSVRDSRTEAFVEDVLPGASSRCTWLPDPTFALDPPTPEERAGIRSVFDAAGVPQGAKTALVISPTSNPALEELIRGYKLAGHTLVGLSHALEGVDVDLSSHPMGPLDWAAASTCADVVLTDRFHGALFALKSGTPVIATDHRAQRSGRPSKIEDLFGRFGVADFCLSVSGGDPDGVRGIEDRIDREWPAERIRATSADFSARLTGFVSGPLKRLALGDEQPGG